MSTFGVQCDAIAKNGKRCKKKNRWELPCTAVYDARVTSYRADIFRPVRLCCAHSDLALELRNKGERLKLHHGGWFGAYNKHKYGNLVIARPTVDWEKPDLTVPKFWSVKEEEQ